MFLLLFLQTILLCLLEIAFRFSFKKQKHMLSKSNKKKNLKAKPKKYFIQKQNNIASKSIIIIYLQDSLL
jgi:hypothetical protein